MGNSVGFALHIALALLVAAAIGFYNGEWAMASKKATSWIWCSIAVLVIAVVTLTFGMYVQSQHEPRSGTESPAVKAETSESCNLEAASSDRCSLESARIMER